MKKHEILVALSDDNPHSFMAIASTLEEMGHHVTSETDGRSAIEELLTKDFDLVITDFLEVLKRAKEVNSGTMVIILTSNSKVTFAIIALRLGADDYIIKPISLIELRHLVAHYFEKLERKRGNSQSEQYDGRLNGNRLNMPKTMANDIRESLLSISASLKMLSRGYYGKMDEAVVNSLKELLSRTTCLIEVAEEYVGRTFSVDADLDMGDEAFESSYKPGGSLHV